MAFRASGYMRSMMQKSRSFSTTTDQSQSQVRKSFWMTAAATPIWMVGGLVVIATSIALHTGKQHLMHNPSVHVNKKRRASLPEVGEATHAVKSGGKMVDKSFLRKVAHIQDESSNTLPPKHTGNIYTRSREAETLDSIK